MFRLTPMLYSIFHDLKLFTVALIFSDIAVVILKDCFRCSVRKQMMVLLFHLLTKHSALL